MDIQRGSSYLCLMWTHCVPTMVVTEGLDNTFQYSYCSCQRYFHVYNTVRKPKQVGAYILIPTVSVHTLSHGTIAIHTLLTWVASMTLSSCDKDHFAYQAQRLNLLCRNICVVQNIQRTHEYPRRQLMMTVSHRTIMRWR